ncbi:MAG: signal peptidase I, partial [Planctomycetota bacterium]
MAGLRLFVGVALACIAIRTFVALGVLGPVIVAGDSMAPRLADGERIVVDQLSPNWRPLRRWDRVVARSPDDARRLIVKRIVGQPGEQVDFRDGDVWVNDQLVRKVLDEQSRLRVPVYSETVRQEPVHGQNDAESRWVATSSAAIPVGKASWRFEPRSGEAAIAYRHPGDGVVRDDLPLNAAVTRRLNPVADLMLTFVVERDRAAECVVQLGVGDQSVRATLHGDAWSLSVDTNSGTAERRGDLDAGNRVEVTLSRFDQQALLAVGEQTLATMPLPPLDGAIRQPQAIAITVAGGGATVTDLAVWRDVYYERRGGDRVPSRGADAWRLGADEWFLVGDNQAVSVDSRSWRSGVPGRLVLGR